VTWQCRQHLVAAAAAVDDAVAPPRLSLALLMMARIVLGPSSRVSPPDCEIFLCAASVLHIFNVNINKTKMVRLISMLWDYSPIEYMPKANLISAPKF
jgi:hypothetical protein